MDQTARRNKRKAQALVLTAETLLIAATLAAGIAVYEIFANLPHVFAVTAAIIAAFGTHSLLAPMFTDVFGPAVNRLRGLNPKGADQS